MIDVELQVIVNDKIFHYNRGYGSFIFLGAGYGLFLGCVMYSYIGIDWEGGGVLG